MYVVIVAIVAVIAVIVVVGVVGWWRGRVWGTRGVLPTAGAVW